MVERIPPEEEKTLADRLRREAQATCPAFSERLHAQIVRAVRERGGAQSLPPGKSSWQRSWAIAVAAAACLAITSLAAWRLAVWEAPIPDPVEGTALVPSTPDDLAPALDALVEMPDGTAQGLGSAIDSALADQRWAYLDHDARVAAGLLLDQLPLDMLAANDEP